MPECSLGKTIKARPDAFGWMTPEKRKCRGPLWECKGYYVNGQSDWKCRKHAILGMKLNPMGPLYQSPLKERGAVR